MGRPLRVEIDPYFAQILKDTEKNSDLGFILSDFCRICDGKELVYGTKGSLLRRKYQKKRNQLQELSVRSLKILFERLEIEPTRHTANYIKEQEEMEKKKKKAASNKRKKEEESSEDDDSSSDSKSSISTESEEDDNKSKKSTKSTKSSTASRKKSKTPPRKRRDTSHTSSRDKARDKSQNRGTRNESPPKNVGSLKSGTFSYDSSVTMDMDDDPFRNREYPESIDPYAPDGTKERPFVIPVNFKKPYANREFNVQYVPQISIPSGNATRHRPALHIKKAVCPQDLNEYWAYLEEPNSNVIIIKGISLDANSGDMDGYHEGLARLSNGKRCLDTSREHEKAVSDARNKDPYLYYKLVLPKKMKIDNFLYSADYTKIDTRRFLVRKQFMKATLITGYVTWVVAFDDGSDSKTGKNDDFVDMATLMQGVTIE